MKDRITELRETLGLSMNKFAKELQLSTSTVSNWETGSRNVSRHNVAHICKTFGVNEKWLLTGEGEMLRPVITEDNELVVEISKLIKSDDTFTKKVIMEYLRLPDESKEAFKDFLKKITPTD